MNILDLCLIAVVVAYGLSGYWQGFVAGLAATIGLLLGGMLGIVVVPAVLGGLKDTMGTALLALFLVLALAMLGQAVGSYLGATLKQTITWRPARSLDAVGGAALSMAAALVVAWALGYAVSGARIPGLSEATRTSTILSTVDAAMPSSADRVLDAFNDIVDSNLFPRYLEPFTAERIAPVAAPDAAVLERPGVRSARDSVVKILGRAECGRGIEGSGFVYAPDRVMTNAHVVAGVATPYVQVGDQRRAAETVLYDPELDVAVLKLDGLDEAEAPALAFDTKGRAGSNGAVLGYPENGPFDARAARIRSQQRLRSPDIYGDGTTQREVFSLRALVRSGNSGGPVVSPGGDVLGVVFAASVSNSSTGYALTAEQVRKDARAGRTADAEVSTEGCT